MFSKLICVFCVLKLISAQYNETSFPCPFQLSIDISNGTKINGSIHYSDGLIFDKDNYFIYKNASNYATRGCICNLRDCIKKCCSFGMKMDEEEQCIQDSSSEFYFKVQSQNKTMKDFYYHPEPLVCNPNEQQFLYSTINNSDDNFTVYENGTVEIGVGSFRTVIEEGTYCIEDIINQTVVIWACVSLDEIQEDEAQMSKYIGMILSMPFLLATFIVYALLPDRNLHMKALMFYVISLLLGYIFLVTLNMNPILEPIPCVTLAYLCIFFLILSFFWINVICLDIWFTFSGLRGFTGNKLSERRRFYYYCAYAWGASLIHILILSGIDRFDTNYAEWYHPAIGQGQCFFKDGYPQFLYMYLPMSILIGINIILFALTAWKIRKVKKETKMLRNNENKRHSSYEKDKQKFNLYLKLVFAMGVNWVMEITSWAVLTKMGEVSHFMWYFTDFCNAAYGIFIFFIFVFKKTIWKRLQKRYYSFTGKPFKAHSINTTSTAKNATVSATNGSMYEMSTNATAYNSDQCTEISN